MDPGGGLKEPGTPHTNLALGPKFLIASYLEGEDDAPKAEVPKQAAGRQAPRRIIKTSYLDKKASPENSDERDDGPVDPFAFPMSPVGKTNKPVSQLQQSNSKTTAPKAAAPKPKPKPKPKSIAKPKAPRKTAAKKPSAPAKKAPAPKPADEAPVENVVSTDGGAKQGPKHPVASSGLRQKLFKRPQTLPASGAAPAALPPVRRLDVLHTGNDSDSEGSVTEADAVINQKGHAPQSRPRDTKLSELARGVQDDGHINIPSSDISWVSSGKGSYLVEFEDIPPFHPPSEVETEATLPPLVAFKKKGKADAAPTQPDAKPSPTSEAERSSSFRPSSDVETDTSFPSLNAFEGKRKVGAAPDQSETERSKTLLPLPDRFSTPPSAQPPPIQYVEISDRSSSCGSSVVDDLRHPASPTGQARVRLTALQRTDPISSPIRRAPPAQTPDDVFFPDLSSYGLGDDREVSPPELDRRGVAEKHAVLDRGEKQRQPQQPHKVSGEATMLGQKEDAIAREHSRRLRERLLHHDGYDDDAKPTADDRRDPGRRAHLRGHATTREAEDTELRGESADMSPIESALWLTMRSAVQHAIRDTESSETVLDAAVSDFDKGNTGYLHQFAGIHQETQKHLQHKAAGVGQKRKWKEVCEQMQTEMQTVLSHLVDVDIDRVAHEVGHQTESTVRGLVR